MLLAALSRPRPAPRRAAFLIANTNRERAPARQNLKTPFCLHRGTHTHREITHTQWFTHIGTGIRCTLHVRSARLVSTGSSYTNIQSNVARNQIGINSKHKQFLATHTHAYTVPLSEIQIQQLESSKKQKQNHRRNSLTRSRASCENRFGRTFSTK